MMGQGGLYWCHQHFSSQQRTTASLGLQILVFIEFF